MKKIFKYPWTKLEDHLQESGSDSLVLFSYGSLMNEYSSSLTLSESESDLIPAYAHGIKRIFNYPMTKDNYGRYGEPIEPQFNAALNAIPTGNLEDSINGVIKEVSVKEVPNLRARELNYDLHQIDAYKWGTKSLINQEVFILCLPEKNKNLLPHHEYVKVCSEGAKSVSEEFLQFFLDKTYLADGKTTLSWWLKNNTHYD